MMTRKDYVAVSDILSNYQDVMDSDDFYEMVSGLWEDDETWTIPALTCLSFMIACGIDTKALVSHAMATLPKSASDHVALVQ